MQDSEAVLDYAQPTMMDLEIRQQTVGLQLHAAVVRENNEVSIPNETVSIGAQDEDFDELLFKDFDFPDSTNISLDTIALELDSDWFRSILQGNSYFNPINVSYFPS